MTIKEKLQARYEASMVCYYENTNERFKGAAEAYQDCLNLMQPRTEQEILKDFEKLGYEFAKFTVCYHLKKDMGAICKTIIINKNTHYYRCVIDNCTPHLITGEIDMQEHKLLYELFEVWKWC